MKKRTLILTLIVILALGLRIFQTGSRPSLYWDEVSLGYDAFSLAKTGLDHRGLTPHLAFIFSYRDYKPPLYIYLLTPLVKVFGLSQLTTRLPSVLAGSLSSLALYALVTSWWPERKKLGFLAAFLIAVNPWAIHFSRLGFEVNLATFVSLLAVLVWSRYRRHVWGSLLFLLLLASTTYTYHGFRATAPLILLTLLIYQIISTKSYRTVWYLAIFALLTLPIYSQLTSPEIWQRNQETSLLTSIQPILESNSLKLTDGNSVYSRVIHHRFVEYGRFVAVNYFKNFNLSFLSLGGDNNPRHGFVDRGLIYVFELIFWLTGLVWVWWRNKRRAFLLTTLILISFIPAGITKSSPHALRSLPANPWLILVIALGLSQLIKRAGRLALVVPLLYLLSLGSYLHQYYFHYLTSSASTFQYGYRPAIEYVLKHTDKNTKVYLSDYYGRAYMYFLFHSHQDPRVTQTQMAEYQLQPQPAQLGNWIFDPRRVDISSATIFITSPNEILPVKTRKLHTIYYPNQQQAALVISQKI